MGFKTFRLNIILRIIAITAVIALTVYLFSLEDKLVSIIILIIFTVLLIIELIHYLENTNRKLTRFLESVRYSDFTSGFTRDSKLGKNFQELNEAFNEVLEAFRNTRKEKEEHLQYLNTLVQHINTGILSFDQHGQIGLLNNTAKKMLDRPQMKNIEDLQDSNPEIYEMIREITPGSKKLYRKGSNTQISMNATELKMGSNMYKLLSLQNINSEMQQNEIESWQNLTRVLRHEIMNSITPIASLTSTLNEILKDDIVKHNGHYEMNDESLDDLREGLQTIENRSKGLANFVDAYRDYTSIPKPQFKRINLSELLDHVITLMKKDLNKEQIMCEVDIRNKDLFIKADEDQIEMVLINLLKNAREAIEETPEGRVLVKAYSSNGNVILEIIDNGPGIIEEAIERIFIPFYTTKKRGSGIGLALSRQIMQLHNGNLSVESTPGVETKFILMF